MFSRSILCQVLLNMTAHKDLSGNLKDNKEVDLDNYWKVFSSMKRNKEKKCPGCKRAEELRWNLGFAAPISVGISHTKLCSPNCTHNYIHCKTKETNTTITEKWNDEDLDKTSNQVVEWDMHWRLLCRKKYLDAALETKKDPKLRMMVCLQSWIRDEKVELSEIIYKEYITS